MGIAGTSLSRDAGILIVDDFATMRKIIRKIVCGIGFNNIAEASNGQEALAMLTTGKYSLLITDWNMPVMSGLELLKSIRADERLKTLPVLMVTAEGSKENIYEAAKAGVNGYILKPFTPEDLKEKLHKVFERIEGAA